MFGWNSFVLSCQRDGGDLWCTFAELTQRSALQPLLSVVVLQLQLSVVVLQMLLSVVVLQMLLFSARRHWQRNDTVVCQFSSFWTAEVSRGARSLTPLYFSAFFQLIVCLWIPQVQWVFCSDGNIPGIRKNISTLLNTKPTLLEKQMCIKYILNIQHNDYLEKIITAQKIE